MGVGGGPRDYCSVVPSLEGEVVDVGAEVRADTDALSGRWAVDCRGEARDRQESTLVAVVCEDWTTWEEVQVQMVWLHYVVARCAMSSRPCPLSANRPRASIWGGGNLAAGISVWETDSLGANAEIKNTRVARGIEMERCCCDRR